jgi:acyl-ACP thioesterase
MTESMTPAEPTRPRKMTVDYRVRFDEAAGDGMARTSALLRYAQDCAWVHAEALGQRRDWYAARGLAWLVRAATIDVLRPIASGDRIAVSTAVVGFRRVLARRRTTIADGAGDEAAVVETDWVMTDLERGAPARIPDDLFELFDAPPGSFEPHRVALGPPPGDALHRTIVVRRHEIDPMGHANNGAYVDWLEEAVEATPDGARRLAAVPRRYRVEYVGPTEVGDVLDGAAWLDGSAWAFRLAEGGADRFRGSLAG